MASLSAVPASLQNIFGPVLVGTWLNAMVYTLEILLAYQFYSNHHLRSPGANTKFVRWLVAFQLLVDTAGAVGDSAYCYLLLVSHWGDLSYLTLNALPIDCLTTGLSGFIVQLYLIWRYSILSKNYIVCAILALGALTSIGGALGTAVLTITYREVSQRQKVVPMTMVWFITSVATDIGIAGALVLKLRSLGLKSTFKTTRSIIHRLTVSTIQTGSATAFVSTLVLILFAIFPNTAIALAPGFALGRLYGCTLLFNLTTRRMGESGNSTEKSDEFSGTRGGGGSGNPRPTRLDTFGGIHVHHIVQVDKDNDIRGLDSRRAKGSETPAEDMGDDVSMNDRKARMQEVI
ncbi:F-box domain-containing protein [Mycena indigotica]|uniref:F-box domain-containing protein n=1 Tax=Mycena indigotica TaxID=2126181 RepID=A0A8H6S127_9AGAR|nr:F-box domain-containing protein [Mycena indigotica]KAF7290280.1 F-box domain-containing protein [Mycena indigotica]